jgi:hypothetical protein
VENVKTSGPNMVGFVRNLGAMERMLHLYSKEHPRHFCVVAEIAGAINPERYRAAFDVVQRRHPMLSVYVKDDVECEPSVYRSCRPLLVDVLPVAREPDWRRVVERELSTPFLDTEGPLMRATVLHDSDRVSIILTFHHVLADGMSGVSIVQDLMEALDGRTLSPLLDIASLEKLAADVLLPRGEMAESKLPPGLDPDALRTIADLPLWRLFDGDTPEVSTTCFDHESTALILRRSKANGTTLHGAICAAVIQSAALRSPKDTFTITSAINLRPKLNSVRRDCALLIGAGTVRFSIEPAQSFWLLARQATEDLAAARSAAGVLKSIGIIEACVPSDADSKLACGLLGAWGYDSVVSNLGALSLPTEVGSLRLEAFWGPAVQGRFLDERVIGAATVRGQLRIIQTSPKHIPSFLEQLRRTLLKACANE